MGRARTRLRGARGIVVAAICFVASASLTTAVVAQVGSGQGFTFDGGPGADMREGGAHGDTLNGNGGTDLLRGRGGADTLNGGADADTLIGDRSTDAPEDDTIDGGAGGDEATGGPGDDTIYGGDGNDVLGHYDFGDVGADGDPASESGDDFIHGQGGNDQVGGGPGHDVLTGGSGDDGLHGGTGDDDLEGGPGDDLLNGFDGDDTVSYLASSAGVEVFLAPVPPPGGDPIAPYATGEGEDTLLSVENVTGSEHPDVLVGDSGANELEGYLEEDHLDGLEGEDFVDGGPGPDVVVDSESGAAQAVDALFGGEGDDQLQSRNSPAFKDEVDCEEGHDVVFADALDQIEPDSCESVLLSGAPRTLTLTVSGPGSIVAPPLQFFNPAFTCSAYCLPAYGDGSTVSLRAVPAPGATFTGWGVGPCSGQQGECTVSMDTDAEAVSAVFAAPPTGQPSNPVAPKPKPKKKKPKKKKKKKKKKKRKKKK